LTSDKKGDINGLQKARMNITIHPTIASEKASARVCDNFIVQEKGEAVRLHTAAHKIYIV
jgi:hypothetical protein